MTITEFLEARIAEDEEVAMDAVDGDDDDGVWHVGPSFGGGSEQVKGKGILIYGEGGHTEDQAAHIAAWDPARVLAECAAKRWVLDTLQGYEPGSEWHGEEDMGRRGNNAAGAVRKMAAVYSDHPDYDKDWTL